MTSITTTTVATIDPANANWIVTIEREDYGDPSEESGILLRVGRNNVMLTLDEARAIAAGLLTAVIDAPSDDTDDTDEDGPETCERCDGSGIHRGDNPGTPRHHECAECGGYGRP